MHASPFGVLNIVQSNLVHSTELGVTRACQDVQPVHVLWGRLPPAALHGQRARVVHVALLRRKQQGAGSAGHGAVHVRRGARGRSQDTCQCLNRGVSLHWHWSQRTNNLPAACKQRAQRRAVPGTSYSAGVWLHLVPALGSELRRRNAPLVAHVLCAIPGKLPSAALPPCSGGQVQRQLLVLVPQHGQGTAVPRGCQEQDGEHVIRPVVSCQVQRRVAMFVLHPYGQRSGGPQYTHNNVTPTQSVTELLQSVQGPPEALRGAFGLQEGHQQELLLLPSQWPLLLLPLRLPREEQSCLFQSRAAPAQHDCQQQPNARASVPGRPW